ncbi:FMN-binding protein [Desulfocurvibacter africanus]|uniref:RnfABCDGE type electron transport complex subunit G n=1 Tax=Desulfocurvibacter africanus TaxID=873 RepID=UPI002FDA545A
MREMFKMVVVLSVIAGLSGLTLASLREYTAPRIEEQVLAYVQRPVLDAVIGQRDNDPVQDRQTFVLPSTGHEVLVFPVIREGRLVGVAFETQGPGYGGDIGVITAFSLESDRIMGIGMTTMKETPGVGTRVAQHGFTTQFHNRALDGLALSAQGGSVNAVAGATVSSTGAVEAVRQAAEIYKALKPEFEKTWS